VPKVAISEPTIELGENRYLQHYIFEVFIDDELAGHIFVSRYSYRSANEDQVMRRWLCQRDSYTEHNSPYMLEETSPIAQLPRHLAEVIEDKTGLLILLDEVTFMPRFRGHEHEIQAIRMVCDSFSGYCDAIITPDFGPVARYIQGINTNPIAFWERCGFVLDASQTMINTKDEPNTKSIGREMKS